MRATQPLDLSPFGKVFHRSDTARGRWITRINYPNPIGRVDTSFDVVEEANGQLLEEYQRRHTGAGRRRAPITIAELAESWYRRRVRRGLAAKTLAADRAMLDARIIPDWGPWKVDQVTPLDVQDWIDRIETEPHLNAKRRGKRDLLSEGMVHKYRRTLDGVLREGVRQGMIPASPAAGDLIDVTLNRAPQTATGAKVFTDSEISGLWHAIDPRYRALIPLAAYGVGLRIGEWAGLATTDFDPRTRDLSFRRKVIEVVGEVRVEEWLKGRNPGRTIRLGEDLTGIWTDHVARHSTNGWVFPAPEGGILSPGNFRNRVWRPAVEAIGRPAAKFHWLRDTNVTKLREAGIDIEGISKHVGHANVAITSRVYSHQTDAINDEIAAAQDRLAARMER